jgi:hypothetical protein
MVRRQQRVQNLKVTFLKCVSRPSVPPLIFQVSCMDEQMILLHQLPSSASIFVGHNTGLGSMTNLRNLAQSYSPRIANFLVFPSPRPPSLHLSARSASELHLCRHFRWGRLRSSRAYWRCVKFMLETSRAQALPSACSWITNKSRPLPTSSTTVSAVSPLQHGSELAAQLLLNQGTPNQYK